MGKSMRDLPYDLFIFAGEHSGDLHGENILQALKKKNPHLRITGVGGPRMRRAGLDCFLEMEAFQVMGFIDVISSLPHLYQMFRKIEKEILLNKPKGVLFIDYPGFNLRLARRLKKKQTESKLFHFVCPSVWAWGKNRIALMENSLDKLITILPFEPQLFSKDRLDVSYVGNPLISRINTHKYNPDWRHHYDLFGKETLISLFPGSRQKEIERNFPLQLKVAQQFLKKHKALTLAISCSDMKFLPLLKTFDLGGGKIILPSHTYELMQASYLSLATSGTVTLELALHRVPTIVTYAITSFDTFLARKVFRINLPYYALPNLIANREIFPELFGPNLREERLYYELEQLLKDEVKREQTIEKCDSLRDILGEENAANNLADQILEKI
jgi:lipid-A-disaccharide synthase